MASNQMESLFQCSHCENELNRESKSFPCLHSFCATCLNKEVKRETDRIDHCPKCDEIGQIDKLSLSPVLISYLKSHKIESTKWKCDFCLEDQIESIATNWCENCFKFLCDSCDRSHKKFNKQHFVVELNENGKEKVKKSIRVEKCKSHNKMEDLYCKQCNVCLCDTCYMNHLKDPGDCSPLPISVEEEAKNKQNSQIPKLLIEIGYFEKDLEGKKFKSRNYCEELQKQCELKCEEFWQNYNDTFDKMREKTHEMCDELRQITKDQVKKWQKFLRETENMLKKFEIWRLNLHHLLKKGSKEKDVVLGVELVARNLESSLVELNQKIKEPLIKWTLRVKYSDSWQEFLENLETEKIGFGILDFAVNSIEIETEWNLPESNTDRGITSLVVSDEDHHLFLADNLNNSIVEMTESGEFVGELELKGQNGEKLRPTEMFFDSSQILGVNCQRAGVVEEYLIFLERKKIPCFLQIKNIIKKKKTFNFSFSVCKNQKEILFCDQHKFKFDFYTEKGEFLKTIDPGVETGGWCTPRIRADPSTGQIWGAKRGTCEIFSFDKKRTKIQSFKTEEKVLDFFINKFGQFFFGNFEGIFIFFPEKKLHKNLFKFQRKSECDPKLFILREKMFVFLQIDEKYFIKIFKFLD